MTLYNRNCEKLNLKRNKMSYLNEGQCALVYHNESMILKEYFSDTSLDNRLDSQMFDILRNINNKHFIELYELYSNMSLLKLLKYKRNKLSFRTDAYTAKYYDNDGSINILFESIDYALENFRELDKLFEIFSKNKIITRDVDRENTVINSDGIIIIDPDLFYMSRSNNEYIAKKNKRMLLALLKNIFLDTAMINKTNYYEIKAKINSVFDNIKINENTDVAYEISKKLDYVKRPIDYFLK